MLGGVLGGHRRADHDVAEKQELAPVLGRPGPRSRRVGKPPTGTREVFDGEGQHVGRAAPPQELLVEPGHGGAVHEEQRDLGRPSDAAGLKDGAGQGDPPREIDRDVVLLVGGEDVNGHRLATPPPARRPR